MKPFPTPNTSDFLIIQLNMNNSYDSEDELMRIAKKYNSDIRILQEPQFKMIRGEKLIPQSNYIQIGNDNAAILVKKGINFEAGHKSTNIVSVIINKDHVFSVYASPNQNNKDIGPILDQITGLLPIDDALVLIGGDFNAGTAIFKSTLNVNNSHNIRTSLFDIFIASNSLTTEYYEAPTWRARGSGSITDYTLTRDLQLHSWNIDKK